MNINLLQIILGTPVQDADSVNIADSAKVAFSKLAENIVNNPSEVAQEFIKDGIHFGIKVLAACLIYVAGSWIIKRVKKIVTKLLTRRGSDKAIISFVNSLITITSTIILIIISVSTLGVNTTSLVALLAGGGMAIGMALNGTVQNFAGGIMILIFKPFKSGDYIKVNGYEGYVTEVNIVSTKIRTFDNSIIILPNGSLSNGNIDNFSHNKYHRVKWTFDVAYGTESQKVKEVVMEIIMSDPRVIKEDIDLVVTAPYFRINELRDSSVQYCATAWCLVDDYWLLNFDIKDRIYTELPKHGIQFPFPQLDVHIINKN